MQFQLIAVLLFVTSVLGHSWLACADYRISSFADEAVFDINKCKGWPRGWGLIGGDKTTFGADTGYNFGGSTNNMCRDNLPSPYASAYTAAFPMSQYNPGQNVCMAWPTKNHVAARCNNANIPDHGLKIYMSRTNPSANPTAATSRLVKDFGSNQRADQYYGFQYCPNFCTNQDKATCTGCFTIPLDTQPGTYTFVWQWAFNSDTDIYSNCWEATIGGSAITTTSRQETSQPMTSQQMTSQPMTSQPMTSQQQSSQQMTSQPMTSQQQTSQQMTSAQNPATSPDCVTQCKTVCGDREITKCDCNSGFSVQCGGMAPGQGDDETTSAGGILPTIVGASLIACILIL